MVVLINENSAPKINTSSLHVLLGQLLQHSFRPNPIMPELGGSGAQLETDALDQP